MLDKFIEDLKDSTGTVVRQTSFAIAVAACLLITTGFLCAALFLAVLEKYGPIYACLTGATVFFVCGALAATCYLVRKRQIQRQPVETAKSSLQTALSDPMVMAAALQVMRVVGIKRLVPLIAIGGIAFGLFSKRQKTGE
jgi:hypothetical protein